MNYRTARLIIFRSTLALPAIILPDCASNTVKFIHPETGATVECSASGFGIGASLTEGYVAGCGRTYEERGYLRADQLTTEQRADLERRGLIPRE